MESGGGEPTHHLVGDHEHRLEVVALVDGAGVLGVAHTGDPGQADHGVLGYTQQWQTTTWNKHLISFKVAANREHGKFVL